MVNYHDFLELDLPLKQPGMHNRLNAAAAIAAAAQEKISVGDAQALSNFTGTWRRFEYKGESTELQSTMSMRITQPKSVPPLMGSKSSIQVKNYPCLSTPYVFTYGRDVR